MPLLGRDIGEDGGKPFCTDPAGRDTEVAVKGGKVGLKRAGATGGHHLGKSLKKGRLITGVQLCSQAPQHLLAGHAQDGLIALVDLNQQVVVRQAVLTVQEPVQGNPFPHVVKQGMEALFAPGQPFRMLMQPG